MATGAHCTLGSWGHVYDLYINGNNIADVGLVLLPNTQGQHLTSVMARNHLLAGIVWDTAQNTSATKCNAQLNKNNYLFINGAKGATLFGCNGKLNEEAGTADARNILVTNITNNSQYFSTSVSFGGCGELKFAGGIMEDATLADYNIEVAAANGRITFEGMEITECLATGALFKLAAGITRIDSTLNGPTTGGNTIDVVELVSPGRAVIEPFTRRGNAGKYTPYTGMNIGAGAEFDWVGEDVYDFSTGNNRNFRGGIGGWGGTGGGSAAWDATNKALIATSVGTTSGAVLTFDALQQNMVAGASYAVILHVLQVVGDSQRFCFLISGNRRSAGTIAALAAGSAGAFYRFVYRSQGDETGVAGIIGVTSSTTGTGLYKSIRVVLL